MADEPTETTERAVEESETPETTETAAQEPAKPEVPPEVKRALNKANKEAEALRLKLKEFEDRDKTEAQKLTERAAEAERAAATKDAELLRLRTALKHGISDEDAETFLTGSDEETLTKQAERLVALKGTTAAPRTPAPDPSQGTRGGQPPDVDSLIKEAQAKGDWRTVISLQNSKLDKSRT
ncbi:MAG TPA: hypothetical protein VIP77_16245 [Jiangellaceae bacterium]